MSNDTEVYIALGASSAAYAMALNTETGKKFASEYTWASVVLGTSLVLVMLRFVMPRKYWEKVVLAFVVAGAPMIGRSLFNKLSRLE